MSRGTALAGLRAGVGVLIGLALAGGLLWRSRDVARGEAWLNARLVDALGMADARSIGAAVVFPLDDRFVGFLISTGCSVALLLIPPLVLTAFFVGIRRISWRRAWVSGLVAVALLVLVNQIRLATVVGSMRAWGFQTGYERSHVLIGSAISTIGMIAIAILFLLVLGRGTHRAGRTDAR